MKDETKEEVSSFVTHAMIIGVPKEIKAQENRVALLPSGGLSTHQARAHGARGAQARGRLGLSG